MFKKRRVMRPLALFLLLPVLLIALIPRGMMLTALPDGSFGLIVCPGVRTAPQPITIFHEAATEQTGHEGHDSHHDHQAHTANTHSPAQHEDHKEHEESGTTCPYSLVNASYLGAVFHSPPFEISGAIQHNLIHYRYIYLTQYPPAPFPRAPPVFI